MAVFIKTWVKFLEYYFISSAYGIVIPKWLLEMPTLELPSRSERLCEQPAVFEMKSHHRGCFDSAKSVITCDGSPKHNWGGRNRRRGVHLYELLALTLGKAVKCSELCDTPRNEYTSHSRCGFNVCLKFFAIPCFKRWSLISLPVNVGWT